MSGPKPVDTPNFRLLAELVEEHRIKAQETAQTEESATPQEPIQESEETREEETSTQTETVAEATEPVQGVDFITQYTKGDKIENVRFLKRIKTLATLFNLLKVHFESKREFGNEQSLMEYLGFDEKNVTELLTAIFGQLNPDILTDSDIDDLMVDEDGDATFKNTLFHKVLRCNENTTDEQLKVKLDRISEIMDSFDEAMHLKNIDRIIMILQEIKGSEELMSPKHQIAIADGYRFITATETQKFDTEVTESTLDRLRSATPTSIASMLGNETETGEGQQEQSIAEQFAAKNQQSSEIKELNLDEYKDAISEDLAPMIERLNKLFERFQNEPNQALAVKINKTPVGLGNLFGVRLFSLKTKPAADMLTLITDHFNISNDAALTAKLLEIDSTFSDENIY